MKAFVSARLVAVAAVSFAITAAWPVTSATAAENSKLDAALSSVAQQGIGKTLDPKLLRIEPGQPEPLVQTILRYDGSLDAVRAEGALIRSVIGNIATVDIPASKLAAVAALPSVVSIEAARSQPVRLDVSVPATRADALRTGTAPNWTGGSGKGVIVGIADTGVDFRHLDFRKTDGTTRILGLFDQRASGAAGSPPAPYTYGGECTPAMINSAIAGDPSACTQRDTHGHGTHVAGIAAGNGQATGNGQLAYRMIGMAPDADLLVANPPGTGLVTSNVLDAIAYMKAKAQALGKPLVVNMSFGSYFGARDGTSNYQQALDNLAGAGVILVAAAGNEANVPIRASGTITQGGSASVNFNVPATDSSGAPFAFGQLEIWYPGSNSYGVNVAGPGCAATVTVNPGDAPGTLQTPCGGVEIASTGPNPNNDDRQILVRIGTISASPLVPGAWTITLVGNVVAGGSSPFSIICAESAGGLTFTSNFAPQTTEILTDTSSTRRVIAVASYNTRYSWTSPTGPFTLPSSDTFGPLLDLSDFSSRGPRRNCSNAAKCPAAMKPEITAPGAMIISAISADTAVPLRNYPEADGLHVALNGTSMATPHVTGAVALMLQANPTLTPEQVKQKLFTTIQTNAFSTNLATFNAATPDMPANPNYAWGYGIMDVAAAVRALQPAGSPVTVIEFYNQSLDHYFITWVAAEIANLDSGKTKGWVRTGQSFKTYTAAQTGTSPVCRFYIPPALGDSHFFGRGTAECDSTGQKNPSFVLESPDFMQMFLPTLGTCPANTVQVYRVFSNRADANHRYMIDKAIRDQMAAKGWLIEGDGPDSVVMCSPQ